MLMMNIVINKPRKSGRSTVQKHGMQLVTDCVVDWYEILDGMLSLLPSIVT